MRKLIWLALALLSLSLALGCSGKAQMQANTGSGETTVKVKQEFLIILGANPSTGYDWLPTYDQTMLKFVSKNYEPFQSQDGQLGAGGMDYLRFKALKTGKTEIILDSKKPCEEKSADQSIFPVNIID